MKVKRESMNSNIFSLVLMLLLTKNNKHGIINLHFSLDRQHLMKSE